MAQKYVFKQFDELSTRELYHILRLRNEVFIVEQKCAYADLDNKDQESYHLLYYVDDQLAGIPDYSLLACRTQKYQLGV